MPPEVTSANTYDNALVQDTVNNLKGIQQIQKVNGEAGCNRYIISQSNSALNVLEVYGLFLSWWLEKRKSYRLILYRFLKL